MAHIDVFCAEKQKMSDLLLTNKKKLSGKFKCFILKRLLHLPLVFLK